MVDRVRINTTALSILKQHISEGLSDNENDNDPYMTQTRIGELSTVIRELYELQAKEPNKDYGGKFEALYAQRNGLKEKLAQIKAAVGHTSAEQSQLDKIFATVDDLYRQSLVWDEQMVWQIVECIKV